MVKLTHDFIDVKERLRKEAYDKLLKMYEPDLPFHQKLFPKTDPIDWKKVALFNPKILT